LICLGSLPIELSVDKLRRYTGETVRSDVWSTSDLDLAVRRDAGVTHFLILVGGAAADPDRADDRVTIH
jgi:hypothetical protein